MKEYKTNLMDITWNFRRIFLMAVLLAFDLLMTYTVAQSTMVPIWLNTGGVLMAACVGGPGYGVILAAAEVVIQLVLGGGIISLVKGIAVIAVAAAFGTYVRLGFFSNIKGVLLGVLAICFIDTCIRTPEYFALFGSFSSMSIMGSALIKLLTAIKLPLPFVSALSFFVIDLIDKAIVLVLIHALLKYLPQNMARLLNIEEALPQCVLVSDTAEEEFQAEKDQLLEKAQKKLEKKKAETAADQSDAPNQR